MLAEGIKKSTRSPQAYSQQFYWYPTTSGGDVFVMFKANVNGPSEWSDDFPLNSLIFEYRRSRVC